MQTLLFIVKSRKCSSPLSNAEQCLHHAWFLRGEAQLKLTNDTHSDRISWCINISQDFLRSTYFLIQGITEYRKKSLALPYSRKPCSKGREKTKLTLKTKLEYFLLFNKPQGLEYTI